MPTPLYIACAAAHRIHCFIRATTRVQFSGQVVTESTCFGHNLSRLPVELWAGRQVWEGRTKMTLSVAVKVPFALKHVPLAEYQQRHRLAPCERRLLAWLWRCGRQGLAEIIDFYIQSSKKGVHVHWFAPSLKSDWVAKRTLCRGRLFLNIYFTPSVLDNKNHTLMIAPAR
jgi:hypothetical protein